MKLKFSLISLTVTAALGLASSVASAAVPSVPTPQPVSNPTPLPNTGDGGLIVSVFDTVKGVSLVEYLGLSYSAFQPGATNATPESGLVLDFGALQSYSTVFANSASSDIRYTVMAADNTASSGSYFGKGIVTTWSSGTPAPTNTAISGAANNANNFISSAMITACANANPCTAATSGDASYAGTATWGATYGQGMSAAGYVDTALNFYSITAANSALGTTKGVVTQFANSANVAQWLLTSSGALTYSLAPAAPVPVPAAIWLLLSGLCGVGTLSRRHTTEMAAG